MAKRTIVLEIPDVIEIKDSEGFAFWAGLFDVQVPARGRKPKAELARAIRDYDGSDGRNLPTEIADTDYFRASMADDMATGTPYGTELAEMRGRHKAELAALRAKYSVQTPVASSERFKVTARVPVVKDGEIVRAEPKGNVPGAVKFGSRPKTVEVTKEQIKAVRGDKRGRPSQADTLRAAVVTGKWFPVDLLSHDGWETVLLKDAVVEPVSDAA